MKSLNEEISELKNLMNDSLVLLSETDVVNNYSPFKEAAEKMKLVNEKKKALSSYFPIEKLKNFEKELLFLAKQIEKKFDNIVAEQKSELAAIGAELEIINNRKKLTAYQ